jgi:hypothetical protein
MPSGARLWMLLIGLLLLAGATGLRAQDWSRLPPVTAEFENPPLRYEPIMPANYPGDLKQPLVEEYQTSDPLSNERMFAETESGDVLPQQFSRITKAKDGFFQKLYLAETYIPRGSTENGLGSNDVEISLSVAAPLPNRRNPIVITPGFATHFLDGPGNTDLPPRLYDAYVAFNWFPRFTPKLGAIVSISPSVFSDFEKWDDSAFRTPGKLLMRYTWAQYEREIVLGVIYLDRDDLPWLPAAGVIWTPNPNVIYEIIFPRPRVLFMVNEQEAHEDWLYLGGELGGGSYSIQRVPSYQQDVVTFNDYRIIFGWERRKNGGAGMRLEGGYIFARSFEYASNSHVEYTPDDALMIRGSLSF